MSFSTFIPTTSTSLQSITLVSTSSHERNIQTDIQDFWGSFPCPPPWKPRLLLEVNSTRLDPLVGKTIRTFLAGKCDIMHILSGTDNVRNFESDDFLPNSNIHPTDSFNPKSSVGDPATSRLKWCDTTCQVSFGGALLLVVAAMLVSLVVCVSRHRVRHKMAATRPSRQQLQLSTSISDSANCAEFSNLEIQGDDLFHPPFRHRGLPHPPRSCHPLCDANWNCPNCSSCRPLMGPTSPSDQYYSHSYSAVYETIDDHDDDDFQQTENEDGDLEREVIQPFSDTIDSHQNCVPYHVATNGANNFQLQQHPGDDKQNVAETGFNGDELSETWPASTLPKYVENNGALSRPCESITHNSHILNSSRVNNTSGDCYNQVPTTYGHRPILPASCEHSMFIGSSGRPFAMNQAHHQTGVNSSEPYMPRSTTESATRYTNERSNNGHPNTAPIKPPAYSRGHSDRCHIPLQGGHASSYNGGQSNPTAQLHNNRYAVHNNKPYNIHSCTQPSTFLPNIPSHFFCPACHQDNAFNFSNAQSATSAHKN